MASSRVYVQEGIYDEFVKKVVEKAKTWVVGDPFDPEVRQGPQVRYLRVFKANKRTCIFEINMTNCRWTRSSLRKF